ncbi:hypothetical protein J3A83DRAFT_4188950 [Scleroderma citrinum]
MVVSSSGPWVIRETLRWCGGVGVGWQLGHLEVWLVVGVMLDLPWLNIMGKSQGGGSKKKRRLFDYLYIRKISGIIIHYKTHNGLSCFHHFPDVWRLSANAQSSFLLQAQLRHDFQCGPIPVGLNVFPHNSHICFPAPGNPTFHHLSIYGHPSGFEAVWASEHMVLALVVVYELGMGAAGTSSCPRFHFTSQSTSAKSVS